jgi:hypothetical protein
MPGILIGTDDGLLEVIPGEEPTWAIEGPAVTALDYRDGVAVAAAPGHGVWAQLSDDWKRLARWRGGDGWECVWEGDARSVQAAPGGEVYIGSSQPAVFAGLPGGAANELGALRGAIQGEPDSADRSPAVTAIAFPEQGPEEALFVAVSGSGVWQSNGTFERFEKRSQGLGADLNGIWIHPERADRLFASTASGFYRSDDGARTWVQSISGLDRSRASSMAVLPGTPDTLLLSCARRDPDLDGALFRSANGGVTWTRLMMENEDEWEHAPLVARLWDSEDTLFAVAGDKVWGSHDGGRGWVTLADGIPRALALAPAL